MVTGHIGMNLINHNKKSVIYVDIHGELWLPPRHRLYGLKCTGRGMTSPLGHGQLSAAHLHSPGLCVHPVRGFMLCIRSPSIRTVCTV